MLEMGNNHDKSLLLHIITDYYRDIYVQHVNPTAKSRMFTKSGTMHSRMNCYHNSVVESEFFLATLFIFALGYRPTLLGHTTS